MTSEESFLAVFGQLKELLEPHAPALIVTIDTPTHYTLEAAASEKQKKGFFFGAVEIKKNYVSYYLMPIYIFPDLLGGISAALKKRMQGKSCFNFKAPLDESLLAELKELTRQGFERFQAESLIPGTTR